MTQMTFCPQCGAHLVRHSVAGEVRNHWFCPTCRKVRYDHAMVVVTCFVACGQRLLWVRRNLEPKRGLWAIPGGFLESGETLAEGAGPGTARGGRRVTATERLQLYMTGTITFINQVYVAFRATVENEDFEPGWNRSPADFSVARTAPGISLPTRGQ